jgi:hypothetical protein
MFYQNTKGRLFSKNAKSGKKDVWDVEGILLYKPLLDQVKKRREEDESVDWEKLYLHEKRGSTDSLATCSSSAGIAEMNRKNHRGARFGYILGWL